MGYSPAEFIENAARHLLAILNEHNEITYDHFYDGTDETSEKLATHLGIPNEDRSWYCVEHLMDLAVYELEEQGVVEREELDSRLADGELNYRIILTDYGRECLTNKTPLEFWNAE